MRNPSSKARLFATPIRFFTGWETDIGSNLPEAELGNGERHVAAADTATYKQKPSDHFCETVAIVGLGAPRAVYMDRDPTNEELQLVDVSSKENS